MGCRLPFYNHAAKFKYKLVLGRVHNSLCMTLQHYLTTVPRFTGVFKMKAKM